MEKAQEPGYVFPTEAFPSTVTDDNKLNAMRDSPRLQFFKKALPILVEKISDPDPKVTFESLSVELEELLNIFKEIFEVNKEIEMKILRQFAGNLGISGVARILAVIAKCKEVSDDTRNQMKKLVLDETKK